MRRVGVPKEGMSLQCSPNLDLGVADYMVVHFEFPVVEARP